MKIPVSASPSTPHGKVHLTALRGPVSNWKRHCIQKWSMDMWSCPSFYPRQAPSGPAATKDFIWIHWNPTNRNDTPQGSTRTTFLNACALMSWNSIQSAPVTGDEHNSFNPAYSAVVGMLVVRRVGGQLSVDSNQHKAQKLVDESISCLQKFWPMLNLVLLEYKRMPKS
jgi:hypothetical protein